MFGVWSNLFSTLPNPDPVLRRTGKSIEILDEIRRENHVAACAESREAAVLKKKWGIDRLEASPAAAETVEAVFKELPVRQMLRDFSEAWGYGYQISEILWRRQGGLLLPERVCALPRTWFTFGRDGALRLRSSQGDIQGAPVEPYKFLLTQHRASVGNPYGESKFSSCFWPVTFKKGGLKFWAVFLEKFGMPHAVGKAPRGASDKDRKELLQSLTAMVRDACAAIPDDQSIEFLDTNVSGSTDAYERFAQYHDSEISTAILGHSAGATATPGRLGGDDLAIKVREDIIDNDAAMVADTMNTLIRYIHELNPTLGEKRPEFILYDPKDIDKARAERDSMLLNTGKVRLTKKYFVDNYDFGDEDIEVVEDAVQPDQAEFASTPTEATAAGARGGSMVRAAETPREPDAESPLTADFSTAETVGALRGTPTKGQETGGGRHPPRGPTPGAAPHPPLLWARTITKRPWTFSPMAYRTTPFKRRLRGS
jgi:phage gp29-like protein